MLHGSFFGIFVRYGYSEAPGITAVDPHELLPVAAGGEDIINCSSTPATVIDHVMSCNNRVACDTDGISPEMKKKRRDHVNFPFLRKVLRPSPKTIVPSPSKPTIPRPWLRRGPRPFLTRPCRFCCSGMPCRGRRGDCCFVMM